MALLTSLVSIFLGLQNGDAMNRLVEANSWPHLSINSTNYSEGMRKINIRVANQGVGPAILHDFVVYHDGEPVRNAIQLIQACCVGERPAFETAEEFNDVVKDIGTFTPAGRVIRPGEEVPVIRLGRVEGNEDVWDALNIARFRGMSFRACFCSVFDECWASDLVSLDKTPVASCSRSEEAWRG